MYAYGGESLVNCLIWQNISRLTNQNKCGMMFTYGGESLIHSPLSCFIHSQIGNAMTIANFNPAILGNTEFASTLKASPAFRKLVEYMTLRLWQSPDDTLLHKIFFAHMCVGQQFEPVEPNITMGELCSLIDTGAVQEYMSSNRLEELLLGKHGMLSLFKVLMPIRVSKDIDGDSIIAGGRHRTTCLAVLLYSVAVQLKKMGLSKEEAVQRVDSQQIYVEYLYYNVDNSLNFTLNKGKGKNAIPELEEATDSKLQYTCVSQLVIQDNGSRKPQAGEIESVELSSMGVNPRKVSSVFSGFSNGILTWDKLWRYLSSAHLYDNGYSMCLLAGFRYQTYTSYYPATMRKLLDRVGKALWTFTTNAEDGNYVFRHLMTGCENALPKRNAKGEYKTAAPKPTSMNTSIALQFQELFWERQPIEAWYEHLEGAEAFDRLQIASTAYSEKIKIPELSFVELVVQAYHANCRSGEVNLDKALTASKDKFTIITAFEGLLNRWDANLLDGDGNGILDYFDIMEVEEETDIDVNADDEELDSANWLSADLFGAL